MPKRKLQKYTAMCASTGTPQAKAQPRCSLSYETWRGRKGIRAQVDPDNFDNVVSVDSVDIVDSGDSLKL